MSTAASDRLDRLFANKPRPRKPDSPDTTVKQPLNLQIETSRPSATDAEGSKWPQSKMTSSGVQEGASTSDEDDEYASLFTKNSKKKSRPAKAQLKSRDNATRSESAQSQSVGKIEFHPDGKISVEKPGSKRGQEDSHERVDAYNGNDKPLTGKFCPLSLVAKLPYKYMTDREDKVSRKFFASNKFYRRTWTLHYLHFPHSFNKKALVLIPYNEVQKLVSEISITFNITVSVPPYPVTLNFYDDGAPQPILLGVSKSREDVDNLTETVPEVEPDHGECPPTSTADLTRAFEAFHNKMEGVVLATKGKSTSSGRNKAQRLLQALQEARNQINRAQRYLGLRPRSKPIDLDSGLTWDEEQLLRKERYDSCNLSFNFLDVSKVVEHPFEHQPVIMSIDVEAYERNHNIVTEIGISTLDTLDLVDLPPGDGGENWVTQIRSRHFRIKGREHFINKDFCIGNADAFQFGRSEHIELVAVSDIVDSCFEWPFSVQYKKEGPSAPTQDGHLLPSINPETTQKGTKERKLVLLGHDVGIDLEHLQKLGSEVFNPLSIDTIPEGASSSTSKRHRVLCSVLETLDTAAMYKHWKNEHQPRNLSNVCSSLGIDAWFPHNAGNDARYTLEALIKLLVKARYDEDKEHLKRNPDSKGIIEDEWEVEQMARLDDRIDKARSKVRQQISAQFKQSDACAGASMDNNGTEIDWSLPLCSKQSRNPEISMENQIHPYHKVQQAKSSTAVWPADPKIALVDAPRGGW